MIGEIRYDENGLVICEICGGSFKKLGGHLRMQHKILTADYKKQQGLNSNQSLMCQESIEIARQNNMNNREVVVFANLLESGEKTRFKKGSPGRVRDKVAPQEMSRLRKLHTFNKNYIKKNKI